MSGSAYGDEEAKQTLAMELRKRYREMEVRIPQTVCLHSLQRSTETPQSALITDYVALRKFPL